MDYLLGHIWQIVGAIAVISIAAAYRQVLWLFGVIIVPDDSIGVVTKKFVLFGSNRSLPDGRILALNGEAGYQADTLAPGLHWALWPWQYAVELKKFVTIPVGKVGVVEACDGHPLPSGRILAKRINSDMFQDARQFLEGGGQRGPQIDVMPPGTYRVNPLLFKVSLAETITIPPGQIGVVEARDGTPLPAGRVISKQVACDSYQDGASFLENGGERGPQSGIIAPGSYRINPALFDVNVADVVDIPDNKVGIVTTREGKPLERGEIAGPEVPDHNMFQNPQAFIQNGGCKGLQEQVLLAGRYFINPRFATVDVVDMTEVPIAHVGVVIAYVGNEGRDVSGDSFKHANLVSRGEKGVWAEPLDPGKYPINPYTHKIRNVPTANVVLNWAAGKSEAHKLDANLSTITVRSADGFKFNLDVSQIIHIPRNDAPKVIARFGDMSALVTQVLEPTIGNYFRNSAQASDIIDFLRERSKRQDDARKAIGDALAEYNVGAVDTLIGDIVPPEQLMQTLTDRKQAEQERVTFETQKQAQAVRQELEQATALANTQAKVVDAERQVSISEFNARAAVKQAEGEAQAKTINAEADAKVVRLVGEAEAAKVEAIGTAEASVIKQKIDSMESGNYAVVQVAEALAGSGMKLVPDVVATGGSGSGGGTLVEVLLANLIRDGMHKGSGLPLNGEAAAKPEALPAP
ncbi:SPFH domain-containing protein [Ralstonia solanacearum]|uniref:SPFH domain-containing protein n=1 Tax=Ralstonia solanacearum TaxID=305 RepID=UPI0005ABC601|nr:SPFH domain-containing protein [Ralstonia solanacearum]MDC6177139.1 SPFH domain-containing protein [Ralstonia solanacearum]MDC6238329.1 SPFH domain-containing protein [Ralstonia solanacearum]